MLLFFFNYVRFCIYESSLCSSILFNLFISISIWISFLAASLVSNRKKLILHFSNKNLNIFSIFFIFLSELIRILIRPFVLSIRLIANLTIGHYLINIFFINRSILFNSVFFISFNRIISSFNSILNFHYFTNFLLLRILNTIYMKNLFKIILIINIINLLLVVYKWMT